MPVPAAQEPEIAAVEAEAAADAADGTPPAENV